MLSEHRAGDLKFEGLGAAGASAEEAARLLASLLTRWVEAHAESHLLQLSVMPASPASGAGGASGGFGAMALLTYVDPSLDMGVAAEAVAAAVEEIRDAQAQPGDETAGGPPSG